MLLKTLLFAALASAAVIVQRDNSAALAGIATLETDIATLQKNIHAFKGDTETGYPVMSAAQQTDEDLAAATDAVNNTPDKQWAAAESTQVVNAITKLGTDITNTLNRLGTKADLVKNMGQFIINGVKTELTNLQTGSANLYAAVVVKVADSDKHAVTKSGAGVDAAFKAVIALIPASN